jgi:glycopeptide antibiotics resistance protein
VLSILPHSNGYLKTRTVKLLTKTTLAIYLLTLLWLVLFKFSYDLVGVLLHYQTRSLNLVPFAGYSPTTAREMLDNLIVFVPFGLLLGINFVQVSFRRKLAWIFLFSCAVEALQFACAIGRTDVTDVIMNTGGGLLGLALYAVSKRYANQKALDVGISILLLAVLTSIVLLRTLVLRVRY